MYEDPKRGCTRMRTLLIEYTENRNGGERKEKKAGLKSKARRMRMRDVGGNGSFIKRNSKKKKTKKTKSQ